MRRQLVPSGWNRAARVPEYLVGAAGAPVRRTQREATPTASANTMTAALAATTLCNIVISAMLILLVRLRQISCIELYWLLEVK